MDIFIQETEQSWQIHFSLKSQRRALISGLIYIRAAHKKVELPLKLLTVGDFSNGKAEGPLSEREKINVNKNNFNSVLAELTPQMNLTVKNTR